MRQGLSFNKLSACACFLLLGLFSLVGYLNVSEHAFADGSYTPPGMTGIATVPGSWESKPDPRVVGLKEGWQSGSGLGWQSTLVPGAWNTGDLSKGSMAGGIMWYRLQVVIPDDQTWHVRLNGFNQKAKVWVNGQLAASSDLPYLPLEFNLPSLPSAAAQIVVRVDSRRDQFGLVPAKKGSTSDQPYGEGWWNWGGLIRSVEWWPIQKVQIDRVWNTTQIQGSDVNTTLRADFSNPGSTEISLQAAGSMGSVSLSKQNIVLAPGERKTLSWQAQFDLDQLWTPNNPQLMDVDLSATTPDSQDQWHSRAGLRTVEVKNGKLYLNGQLFRVFGVNLHEQTTTGWASSSQEQDQLIDLAKQSGANIIRTHYPLSTRMLDRADQQGLLVWDEIPLWQPNATAIGSSVLRGRANDALREMILRDRGHPSVMTWSIGNEYQISVGNANLQKWITQAVQTWQQYDGTLPLSVVLQPSYISGKVWQPLQIIGINSYVGWYGGSLSAVPGYLKSWRGKIAPNQALIMSEFGAEAVPGVSGLAFGGYDYQAKFLSTTLKNLSANKNWSGGMVWVLKDFACRPGWLGGNKTLPNPPYNNKGLLDQNNIPKPSWQAIHDQFVQLNSGS